MIARLAYAYVRLLLALEVLLFTASLLLHLSVVVGLKKPYDEYSAMLFRGTVIVGIPAGAFIKDGLRWLDQIKRCPKWMWRAALTLGGYGLLIAFVETTLLKDAPFFERSLTISGLPLGFDAVYSCVLYSVLWTGCLDKSEVINRARNSVIFVTLGVIVFFAYRAGYLHHPENR